MEVSSLRGSDNVIEKPGILSSSIHSATSVPGELILPEQESNKCKHFTIRGFVAEVRAKDAKFCWPFSMLNSSSDEHINQLPPIHVKKFRQWRCHRCLHEIAPKISVANGSNSSQNYGVKDKSPSLLGDATKPSNCKATKSLCGFLQQYGENDLQGIVAQEDNSNSVYNDGMSPLSCCRRKHDTSPTSDSTKGGIGVAKVGYISSKENQILRSKPNSVTGAEQEYQPVETREGNITVTSNSSEIYLLSKATPKRSSSKREVTELIHQTGGWSGKSEQVLRSMSFSIAASDIEHDQGLGKISKRKASDSPLPEHRIPLGVNATIPNNIAIPATMTRVSRYSSKGLVECSDVASDTSSPLIGNLLSCEGDVRKPGLPMDKSCPRKFRKIRTLDDIMKSLKVRNDEPNCISRENAGPTGSDNIEMPDASKQRHEHPNPGNHLIQNTEATEIKTKSQKETIPTDGEGICLSYWLKKVPKKATVRKGLGKSMNTNASSGTPKYANAECLDLNLPISGLGENNQGMIGEKKQNMIRTVKVFNSHFVPQEDSSAHKDPVIPENLQAKNFHSESVETIISEKEMRRELETHDTTHKEAPNSNKKKRALVEDERFSQHCSENSLQKQPGEVKKKQKSMRMSEQETVDDIPMDIVELLAKKQHERHLMNTKHDSANISKPLIGSTMNSSGWVDTAGPYRSNVSMAANRYIYQEDQFKITGNNAWTSVKNNVDTKCRSRHYHTYDRDKQCHQFDLNKEAPGSTSSELLAPSSYIGLSVSGAQLSIIDSNRNYSPRNFGTNGTADNTISPQMFSNVHDIPSGRLNGYPSQTFAQMAGSNLHSNIMYPGPNQKAVGHDVGYQKLVYGSKDTAGSSNSGCTMSANSFAESGNVYHSNMRGAVDLHNTETISASNLLRLIQQSASSGEPRHTSLRYDNMGHSRAFNGDGRNLHRSEIDFKVPNASSGVCGNHELDKPTGNVCKPVRPLPRFGILGPLLHKEITKASDSSTLGFGAGNSSELDFLKSSFPAGYVNELNALKTILKGKTEASTKVPVLKDINIQPSSSRYDGSERISSSVISPQCTVAKDNIGQVVTGSRDGAFQPVRSTSKMEECVVNRNPADFAMPDEDSEYMIVYQEKTTEGMPLSESQPSQSLLHGQKAQKMRKLNDLNQPGTSNKSPFSGLSCSQKAK